MREMKDSGVDYIGHIPANWNVLRNKNAFICAKKIVGEQSSTTQLLSLTTRGVKEKDINNAEGKLPESFDTYQFVDKNDLVMCLFDLDVSAVFSGISHYKGMISPAYKVLSCNKNMNPQYADYWFQYISHGRKFNHYAKNIRFTLNIDEFQALPMIFPPLDEQGRIADYLDTKCSKIDEIIAKQEQIIEKLKEYKLSVITEAVTKGLDLNVDMKYSGISFIGDIPANWLMCKFKHLANEIGDGLHGTPEYDPTGEYYFLNGQNIGGDNLVFNDKTDRLNAEEFVKYKDIHLSENTIFITLNGATYGKTSFYNGEKVLLGKSAGYITLRDGENKKYIRYYLQSVVAKIIMELSLCGSTIANLSLATLNGFLIPLPGKEEQIKIVEYLDKKCRLIDKMISERDALIEKLQDYKKSLIYEVVTGKKEV